MKPHNHDGPHIRTSLESKVMSAPTSDEAMEELRRRAWQCQGIAMLDPSEMTDPFERQAVINAAVKRYGDSHFGFKHIALSKITD